MVWTVEKLQVGRERGVGRTRRNGPPHPHRSLTISKDYWNWKTEERRNIKGHNYMFVDFNSAEVYKTFKCSLMMISRRATTTSAIIIFICWGNKTFVSKQNVDKSQHRHRALQKSSDY